MAKKRAVTKTKRAPPKRKAGPPRKRQSDPGVPIAARRAELALLYQFLSEDLVAWKDAHSGEEEPGTDGPSGGPVVFRIHKVLSALGDAGRTDPASVDVTAQINDMLQENNIAVTLTTRDVAGLQYLFFYEEIKRLAPYNPPKPGKFNLYFW